jgi:SAM-dependent methyltransferase
MRALYHADETWTGLVAFYSIIHIPPLEMALTLREFRRILRPDGRLLLAFHIGDETLHLDDW